MSRLTCVVAVCVACGSKGPSRDEMLDSKRAEMAALLDPVRAAAAKLPSLDRDGIADVNGPFITWLYPNGDTVVISETQLGNLRKGGERGAFLEEKTHAGKKMDKVKPYGTITFLHIAEWAVGIEPRLFGDYYEQMKSGDDAKANVDHYLATRYVIVIRYLDYKAPHVTSSDATSAKFEPGALVAEARVLDIKGGDHGGFRYAATTSDKITASSGDTDTAFAADLDDNARKAFEAKLAKLAPGSSTWNEFVLGEKSRW